MADMSEPSEGSERFRKVALAIGSHAALRELLHGVHRGAVGRGQARGQRDFSVLGRLNCVCLSFGYGMIYT